MRFENSAETSSCLNDGSSPDFDIATVGKASSSFTPGSSIASVAGKKRLPTISCACVIVADAVRPTASMANGHEFLNMGSSSVAVTVHLAARKTASYVRRRLEGLGLAWDRLQRRGA